MIELMTKKIGEVESKIISSEKQIEQLTSMLDEAYSVHQRLLGERDAYLKLKNTLEVEKEVPENGD